MHLSVHAVVETEIAVAIKVAFVSYGIFFKKSFKIISNSALQAWVFAKIEHY